MANLEFHSPAFRTVKAVQIVNIDRITDLAKFFYLQRIKGFDIPPEPWFDDETRAWFDKELAQSSTYLEFGSGGSTRLVASKDISGLSVECDRFFANEVRKVLPAHSNISVIDAYIGLTAGWGVPLPGSPSPRRIRRWRRYVEAPFDLLTTMPDLILVDGRFRRACTLRCAMAAKVMAKADMSTSAKLLFDDYFMDGRSNYHSIEGLLGKPERIGRAAHFLITPDNNVSLDDIEEALQDYR